MVGLKGVYGVFLGRVRGHELTKGFVFTIYNLLNPSQDLGVKKVGGREVSIVIGQDIKL